MTEITALPTVAAAKYRSPSSKTAFEKCSTEITTMKDANFSVTKLNFTQQGPS
jgi:hypothetical protein